MPTHCICEHCGEGYIKPVKYGSRPSRFCSRRCSTRHTARRAPVEQRFWPKVRKSAGCWEWTATKNAAGYGKLARTEGGMEYAHRIAWEMATGDRLTSADRVGHTCDNTSCIRNDDEGFYEVDGVMLRRLGHLFKCTQASNMADAALKGRTRREFAHFNARLSDDDVRAMRARHEAENVTSTELANDYGVSAGYVRTILNGQRRVRSASGLPRLH
jgi:hypothetical protein